MSVRPLAMPPAALSSTAFKATIVKPERLFRVSEHTVDKPYFGASGRHRFDAPGPAKPVFGASYLGMSLHVAVAESLLHDEEPVDGRFLVAPGKLARQFVHRYEGVPLKLLNLTGATLKRLDGSAELTGADNYPLAQQWSLAVFQNSADYDGFIYASRHHTTGKAVVLFDRCAGKIRQSSHTQLPLVAGFKRMCADFGIAGA